MGKKRRTAPRLKWVMRFRAVDGERVVRRYPRVILAFADKLGPPDGWDRFCWEAVAHCLADEMSALLRIDDETRFRKKMAQLAAEVRHRANRAAKDDALRRYSAGSWKSVEKASEAIALQVSKSPATVRKWIFERRRTPQP